MYCLGIASEEETVLVNKLVAVDEQVQDELAAINNSLAAYASRFRSPGMSSVKQEIFARIGDEFGEPSLLSENSSAEEWLSYLTQLNLNPPKDLDEIMIHELPNNGDHSTMILWAGKGAAIPVEEHEDINEHFLVCSGSCEMMVNGSRSLLQQGNYFCIHPHQIHSGIVISGDPMIMIVQRRAA